MPVVRDIQRTNSTSYVDLLGVSLGLERLPGEKASGFLMRLMQAASELRDHSLPGMLNEIRLQLGLKLQPVVAITSTDPSASAISQLGSGLVLTSTSGNLACPLVYLDSDKVWVWYRLSDIVARINLSSVFHATLLVDDAPALQIARQSNVFYQLKESIIGIKSVLKHSGIVIGSEQFSQNPPPYNLTVDGDMTFSWQPPDGLTVSYSYVVWPYDVVGSDVGLIGLVDPGFSTIAKAADGTLAYQVREVVQSLVDRDRSYWAR